MTSLSFGAVTFVPILMHPMGEDLGWDRTTLSLGHSLAMVAAGIGGLVIGYLTDRINFAILCAVAALATSGGLLLCARATTPFELYVGYALLVGAVGQATFFGPITANVGRWFDRNSGVAMAIVLSGQSIGGLLVPVALRNLAVWWGWRDAVTAYGLFCLVTMGLASLLLSRKPGVLVIERGIAAKAPTGTQGQFRIFWGAVFLLALANGGTFIIVAHLVALAEEKGFSPNLASGFLTMLLGATLISRLMMGRWNDRGNTIPALLSCTFLIPLGGVLLLLGGDSAPLIAVGCVTIGLGYGGVFPAYVHLVRNAFSGAAAGTSISAMFFFAFLAAAVGSWAGGVTRDLYGGYEVALTISIALSATSFLAGTLILRRRCGL
jgi:MFS family permease